MSSSQARTSQDEERYSLREVKTTSEYFAKRTIETHAQFFVPYLRAGMRLLDCGCGPGTISVGLAKAIAPGQLVGIDLDEQHIELARQHATDIGVSNVHFETANVYHIPYDDQSFDAVFCHAVLEHLEKPDTALAEIYRVLKPQGLFGIRTPDHDGNLLWPEHQGFIAAMDFLKKMIASHGGDGSRGKQFRARLVNAGFVDIQMSASYESFGTPEGVRAWAEMCAGAVEDPKFIERVVSRGLVDGETLAEYATACREWAQHPGAFHARTWCEAIGWISA